MKRLRRCNLLKLTKYLRSCRQKANLDLTSKLIFQSNKPRVKVYKDRFYHLHQRLLENMQNDQELTKKARKLQKQLNSEALKLEKA